MLFLPLCNSSLDGSRSSGNIEVNRLFASVEESPAELSRCWIGSRCMPTQHYIILYTYFGKRSCFLYVSLMSFHLFDREIRFFVNSFVNRLLSSLGFLWTKAIKYWRSYLVSRTYFSWECLHIMTRIYNPHLYNMSCEGLVLHVTGAYCCCWRMWRWRQARN